MKLVLSVISQTGAAIADITLNQESATIGRAHDNSVILDDAKRYISSHHAVIDYRQPDYYLTDISTNGVIINNAAQPLGNGNSIRLNAGDQLHIGDYTLTVKIIQSTDSLQSTTDTSGGPLVNEPFDFDDDPFADLGKDSVQEMIDENQLVPEEWKGSDDESDHVFDFPSFVDSGNQGGKSSTAEVDQPPAYKEAFEPFHGESEPKKVEPVDIFDEDWFLQKQDEKKSSEQEDPFAGDFFAEHPSEAPNQGNKPPVVKQPPHQVPSPARPDAQPIPRPANSSQQSSPESHPETLTTDLAFEEVIAHFLRGAGLEGTVLKQSLSPESFDIVGKILRASVQGTLDVLIGRAKIKNEMHLDVTMIRSRQNNPIKFSVSAEEAIKKLLAPEDAGYLPAEEAIEEAFDDIKAHQFSVIAGMQTALMEVLKRFDPQKLEQRLQAESPISASIPIHKQAKLWRLFEHLYKDIEHEAADNFYHLFGQAFAETYQQQINKLKNAKKESPF